LLTKRIIFSFLAVFLYTFQFATFYWFIFGYVFEDVEIPMRRELNTYLFDGVSGNELFFINFGCIAFLLALSYWQSSVICRFSRAVSFGFKTKIINRLKKDLA
jgi:ABC-type multidrug transport system permease subunit